MNLFLVFYPGSIDAIMKNINDQEDKFKRIMVVGHNPVMETMASTFCSTGKMNIKVTTGCLIYIKIPVNKWSELKHAMGILQWIVKPKILKKIIRKI